MMSKDLQYIERIVESYLPDSTTSRVGLLTGAGQTGKTTLVKHNYPDLNYINLDSHEYCEKSREIPSARWGIDVGNAIIDEVQKEPLSLVQVNYCY